MVDRNWFAVAGFALLLMFAGLQGMPESESKVKMPEDVVNASFSSSEDSWALLEVADNETEREEGLMNIIEMDRRKGMLFKFEEEDERIFWMKNTFISLDMIFINSEKEVINVETAQPQPNATEEELERYRSEEPAKYVIEVNARFAENYSITEGTEVSWKEVR